MIALNLYFVYKRIIIYAWFRWYIFAAQFCCIHRFFIFNAIKIFSIISEWLNDLCVINRSMHRMSRRWFLNTRMLMSNVNIPNDITLSSPGTTQLSLKSCKPGKLPNVYAISGLLMTRVTTDMMSIKRYHNKTFTTKRSLTNGSPQMDHDKWLGLVNHLSWTIFCWTFWQWTFCRGSLLNIIK